MVRTLPGSAEVLPETLCFHRSEATATVFATAFQALAKRQRMTVMEKLLAADPQLARDLVDIALINERRAEPSRTLSSYLKKRHVQRG